MNNAVTEITPWQLFLMGGPVMWPILACSIAAVTIVIEKTFFFLSVEKNERILSLQLMAMARNYNIKEAVAVCGSSDSLSARVMKAGLLEFGASKDDVVKVMEEAARFEVPHLEKGMGALSTIASVTPLLGLLGTVLGLCNAFHTIQVRALAMNPVTPGDIAGGVWQALLTTVAGLVVAIPSFIAYNYFVARASRIIRDMEKAAAELAQLITRASDEPVSSGE